MSTRVVMAGIFVLAAAAGVARSGEVPGQGKAAVIIKPAADLRIATTGLPPIPWTGPVCSNYREWQALPYIYRYCANRQQGYEAQRDDYYKTTSIRYLGSQLVDCDSTQGWKPTGGNMKTFYCP